MTIKSMMIKQMEIDFYIAKEKGLGDPYDRDKYYSKTKLALLVEVGELANATRCFKYWSNKNSESRERLLDEAADCLHFIYRLMIFDGTIVWFDTFQEWEEYIAASKSDSAALSALRLEVNFNNLFWTCANEEWDKSLIYLLSIAVKLGLGMKELEEAYLKKHEENYRRQQQGY